MSHEHTEANIEHHHPKAHEHAGIGHAVPMWFLAFICAILLLLTGVTVFSSFIDFNEWHMPEMNLLLALIIATVKASIVCLYFMHLRWDRPFVSFIFITSVIRQALFIGFAITDTKEYQTLVDQNDSSVIQDRLTELGLPK